VTTVGAPGHHGGREGRVTAGRLATLTRDRHSANAGTGNGPTRATASNERFWNRGRSAWRASSTRGCTLQIRAGPARPRWSGPLSWRSKNAAQLLHGNRHRNGRLRGDSLARRDAVGHGCVGPDGRLVDDPIDRAGRRRRRRRDRRRGRFCLGQLTRVDDERRLAHRRLHDDGGRSCRGRSQWRRRRLDLHGLGSARDRDRNRGRRLRGKKVERVEVAVGFHRAADSEMHVCFSRSCVSTRAHHSNRLPFRYGSAANDGDRSKLEQRDRVAVRRLNRQRVPAVRHGADERHRSRSGGVDRRPDRAANVDSPMLTARVWIGSEREGPEDRPVQRPGPAGRGG
jgi:hypothetical protein